MIFLLLCELRGSLELFSAIGPAVTAFIKADSRFFSVSNLLSIVASDDGPAGGCLLLGRGFTWVNSSMGWARGGFFI